MAGTADQLQHAHKVEGLRTTSTLDALDAAVQDNLVASEDAEVLRDAWLLATKIRGGNVLRGVRQSDLLPTLRDALEAVARWSGYTPGSARQPGRRLSTGYPKCQESL